MNSAAPAQFIENWNDLARPAAPSRPVQVHDETLRDGLQSPSVTQPTLPERLELLHLMHRIGVDSVDLGMPVTGPVAARQVRRLAEEIRTERLGLSASCAARTVRADIAAVARAAQDSGLPMWVMAFVGTSPIRLYVEGWSAAKVLADVRDAVAFARREGLRVCLVTEDTTRSKLDMTLDVYAAGLVEGAERVCVCDTVGHATPWGAAALVTAVRAGLADRGFPDVGIDWHGHNDRGLAVANSLAAAQSGADRVHGSALGIGERAGNAALEQLLVNLDDIGWRSFDPAQLPRYCALVARSCGVPIPANHPFFGADVYRTATGVHAAAISKARESGDNWLAERVYAGIPAGRVGVRQRIEVGPGSGRANIVHWLRAHDIAADSPLVQRIRDAVAGATRVLSDAELLAIVARAEPAGEQSRQREGTRDGGVGGGPRPGGAGRLAADGNGAGG
ncbi:LeuA family protein [Labedaea rhizosphaerae]|nr:LeuA family protein [Labedaea rhizosphaerae]